MRIDEDLRRALHAAGEVPPPPDRDGARARSLEAIKQPRTPFRRSFVLLVAAALLAFPAAVFAARGLAPKIAAPKAPRHRTVQHTPPTTPTRPVYRGTRNSDPQGAVTAIAPSSSPAARATKPATVAAQEPHASPSASPTEVATASPSASPSIEPTPRDPGTSPSPTPSQTEDPSPSPSPSDSSTPSPSATPSP